MEQPSREDRIFELMYELKNMPEYELYNKLETFGLSLYIFEKNFRDLRQLIIFLAKDERAEHLEDLRNRDQFANYMREIIRLLHNFVAGALSLIDHTRVIYTGLYKETTRFPDYEEKKNKEFKEDPLSAFVKDLRRYCQHYRAPNLIYTVQLKDNNYEKSYNLTKTDLLGFNDWTHNSKEYIKQSGDEIDILDLITAYRNKVIGFYSWFRGRQNEIHRDELLKLKLKENELLLLQIESQLDAVLSKKTNKPRENPEDVFLLIFVSSDLSLINEIPIESRERPKKVIEILIEKGIPIPDNLSSKIYDYYKMVSEQHTKKSRKV